MQAFTGLEGGVVASGSTCGVISGGCMGLALHHGQAIMDRGAPAQIDLFEKTGEYIRWFEKKYGSSLCRERTKVNFNSITGMLRYLAPGDKVFKCIWHIKGAIRYLHDLTDRELSTDQYDHYKDLEPIHCAQRVLKGIREKTGVRDDLLENLSFIFDGGLGLQGGVCGALAGAIMGLNLSVGHDFRNTSYFENLKGFTIGHMNLLRNPAEEKIEPFSLGKDIVRVFKKEAGGLECSLISGRTFSGWSQFQEYISSSDKCAKLIDLAESQAVSKIKSSLANQLKIHQ